MATDEVPEPVANMITTIRSQITVRPAQVEDLPRLKILSDSLAQHYRRTIPSDDYPFGYPPSRSADEIWANREPGYRRLLETGGWLLVAEFRGRIVGFCAARVRRNYGPWAGEPVLDTTALALLPVVARPAAECLSEKLREMARAEGVRLWTATCLAANWDVRRYFEMQGGRIGFVTYCGVEGNEEKGGGDQR